MLRYTFPLSNFWRSYYSESDSHIIRDKVKVLLELSNYATEVKLKDATGVDIIAINAEVHKLDTNKLVNVRRINNVKTKRDDLVIKKLKSVYVDLKELSHVVDKEVAETTRHNKLYWKVDDLENKIPDTTYEFNPNKTI